MANNVYNITEIVGTSPEGIDQAITNAIAEASRSLRHLDWFEVQSVRGHIEDGKIADWQVTVKVGFRHENIKV
jgi:dodecin